MAKSLVDSVLDSIFTEKFVGRYGEWRTEVELKITKLFGKKAQTPAGSSTAAATSPDAAT